MLKVREGPMADDKAAREKIVRARTNLIISNGFFGFLAMQLRLKEAIKIGNMPIDTMAVDGKTIFYNPDFTNKLTERETEGVLAHEVMHCCFKHFTRRGHRSPMGWNIAGDFIINNDLIAAGFTLPGKPLSLKELLGNGKHSNIYLQDPTLDGNTTEDVYEKLHITKISIGSGDGSDPGGCGGVLDAPGDQNSQDQLSQTWETQVRAAVAVAKANNAGNIPGSLRRLIEDLDRPKVSWRDQTRRFIDFSVTKDVSWARINRRSTAVGTLMPGYVSDRMHRLVCCNDISGSVSDAMLREMVSEVGGALDQGSCDQLTVMYADTEVQRVDEFYVGDIVKAESMGGGGTDFRDSFRWIKENAADASCVIYLTDLQVSEFGEDPGCPVLWAVFGPSSQFEELSSRVPFGVAIHVSENG